MDADGCRAFLHEGCALGAWRVRGARDGSDGSVIGRGDATQATSHTLPARAGA
jgi:hypothetical protein